MPRCGCAFLSSSTSVFISHAFILLGAYLCLPLLPAVFLSLSLSLNPLLLPHLLLCLPLPPHSLSPGGPLASFGPLPSPFQGGAAARRRGRTAGWGRQVGACGSRGLRVGNQGSSADPSLCSSLPAPSPPGTPGSLGCSHCTYALCERGPMTSQIGATSCSSSANSRDNPYFSWLVID